MNTVYHWQWLYNYCTCSLYKSVYHKISVNKPLSLKDTNPFFPNVQRRPFCPLTKKYPGYITPPLPWIHTVFSTHNSDLFLRWVPSGPALHVAVHLRKVFTLKESLTDKQVELGWDQPANHVDLPGLVTCWPYSGAHFERVDEQYTYIFFQSVDLLLLAIPMNDDQRG